MIMGMSSKGKEVCSFQIEKEWKMEWEKTLKHNKHRREAQRRGQSGPDALREDHDGKI